MIVEAGNASPKKVRLAQIKGFSVAVKELIWRKRDLLVPEISIMIKPNKNERNTAKLILYPEFIIHILS
jgi:hypothetical protein